MDPATRRRYESGTDAAPWRFTYRQFWALTFFTLAAFLLFVLGRDHPWLLAEDGLVESLQVLFGTAGACALTVFPGTGNTWTPGVLRGTRV